MPKPSAKPAVYSVTKAEDGYAVCRDGVSLKTPAGAALTMPTASSAEAIAAELRSQTGKPDPSKTPFLILAATALDIVSKSRETAIDQIAAYAENDLLCYRAEEPPELSQMQEKTWQPLLNWCAQTFKAPLHTGTGIMPIRQTKKSCDALRRVVAGYDHFRLAGLGQAVGVSGSLVLGFALIEGHITAKEAFAAAELDTTHQMEKWGEDPAALARRESIKRELAICEKWFGLLT